MQIQLFHCAILVQQLQRRFFPHAGYTGNIIGAVAHKSFQVPHLIGHQIVFLVKGRIIITTQFTDSFFREIHAGFITDQLQAVLIPCDNDAGDILLFCPAHHGADDIVPLVAFGFINGNVHGAQHILNQIHLPPQFLRHPLALRFIISVLLMAKYLAAHIKGHRQIVGLLLLHQAHQHIGEAVHCVGNHAFGVAQNGNGIKCPVGQTVSINHN